MNRVHYLEGTLRSSIPSCSSEVDNFTYHLCNFASVSSVSARAEWLLIAVKKRKNSSKQDPLSLSFQWHSYAAAPAVFPGTAVDKHRVTKVLQCANVCKTALFINHHHPSSPFSPNNFTL